MLDVPRHHKRPSRRCRHAHARHKASVAIAPDPHPVARLGWRMRRAPRVGDARAPAIASLPATLAGRNHTKWLAWHALYLQMLRYTLFPRICLLFMSSCFRTPATDTNLRVALQWLGKGPGARNRKGRKNATHLGRYCLHGPIRLPIEVQALGGGVLSFLFSCTRLYAPFGARIQASKLRRSLLLQSPIETGRFALYHT